MKTINNIVRKIRYFIYCRKSSDAEDKQVQSIESQMRELEELAKQNGFEIVEIICETQSAHSPGRPKFNEMVRRIEAGEADGILVWHANRISRNPVDSGRVIYALDTGALKEIRMPGRVFYNNPGDKFFLQLEFSVSKKDSDDKSVFVKNGLKTRYLKGLPSGVAHIGYLNDLSREKGDRGWYEDEARFPLVKRVLELFVSGKYSARQVWQIARDELKLTTPTRKKSGGKPVCLSYIYIIFSNPVYAGFFYYMENGQQVRQELDKNLRRMISEEDYWKIQDMLGKKGRPRSQKRENLYSGLIWDHVNNCTVIGDAKFQVICSKCKCKFSYINRDCCPKCQISIEIMENPKYLNYVFYYSIKEKKDPQIKAKGIEEREIDNYLVDYFSNNVQISKELSEWCIKHLSELEDTEIKNEEVAVKAKEDAAVLIKRKLSNLLDLRISRDLGPDYTKLLDEKEMQLKAELEQIEGNKKADNKMDLTKIKNSFELMPRILDILQNGSKKDKKDVLLEFGSNLTFNAGKVSICNAKEIQMFVDGLNCLKSENPLFEPKTCLADKDKTEVFASVRPSLLRG